MSDHLRAGMIAKAASILEAEGGLPGHSLHSWRCEDKDRYPEPCTCVVDTVTDIIGTVEPEIRADERERSARWKAEATEVIREWERVWEALGSPGRLGESKAAATLAAVNDDHDEMCLFARQSEAMGVQSPRSADECLLCRQCRIARRGVLADLRVEVAARIPATHDAATDAYRDVLALFDGSSNGQG